MKNKWLISFKSLHIESDLDFMRSRPLIPALGEMSGFMRMNLICEFICASAFGDIYPELVFVGT